MRLINADAIPYSNSIIYGRELVDKYTIDCIPTIDPENLRPQGEWIKVGIYRDEDGCLCYEYGCSLCNRIVDELEPYCPNCGAKMKTHN